MIYLNNAATTFPKPQTVIDAVNRYLTNAPVDFTRSGNKTGSKSYTSELRSKVSEFFNCNNTHNVIITSGSTEALNLAIKGFGFENCNIITTQIEHNSVLRPLNYLNKFNVETKIVNADNTGFVSPDDIRNHIDKNTKAIVINHCSNVTGTIQDIKAISKIAKDNGLLFILDASQSAGAVCIDLSEVDIDAVAITGHKSLYGITGSGVLILKKEHIIQPFRHGGTGVLGTLTSQPEEFPYRYESGTLNYAGIIALTEGINWINSVDLENIMARKKRLWMLIYENLNHYDKLHIYHSIIHNSFGVFTFNIKGILPEEVNFILENSFEIIARAGLHCSPLSAMAIGCYPQGTVRVSPSYFTNEEEIYYFITALQKICESDL